MLFVLLIFLYCLSTSVERSIHGRVLALRCEEPANCSGAGAISVKAGFMRLIGRHDSHALILRNRLRVCGPNAEDTTNGN